MSRTSYATRIRLRIAELEQQIAAANAELAELRVAERVLGRFSGLENDDEGSVSPAPGAGKEPTISDQIIEILSENGPLDTAMIFGRLNEARSSPASLATVQSTLSRVKASNRIGHDGSRWYVVKNDPPQGELQTNKAPEGALNVFD
jgi:hypothetical protein